jgi:hypothetical protein
VLDKVIARWIEYVNIHFGGLVGYSSGNWTSSLKRPPSHRVFSLPGIEHSHFWRSRPPCEFFAGFATKPKGWSLRHCFLSSERRLEQSDIVEGVRCQTGQMISCVGGESMLVRRHGWQSEIDAV